MILGYIDLLFEFAFSAVIISAFAVAIDWLISLAK